MCSLLSSISPHQSNSSMDYIITINPDPEPPFEIIINDPSRAQEIIPGMLAANDGENQVIELLGNIWRLIVYSDGEAAPFLACVNQLHSINTLIALMEKEPILFLYANSVIPADHPFNAKEIFKKIAEEAGWKERLAAYLINLKDSVDGVLGNHFYTKINYSVLQHLEMTRLNEFINYFVKSNRYDCLACLFVSLPEDGVYYAIKKFTDEHSWKFFLRQKELISTLAPITTFPSDRHLYKALIRRCRKNHQIDDLFFELHDLPFAIRTSLVEALSSEEKKAVFSASVNPAYFCDLLEARCFLKDTYQERKVIMQLALSTIQSDKVRLRSIITEMCRRKSWLSANLLVSLSREKIQSLLYCLSPTERTDLFISCPPDNTMPALFEDLSKDPSFCDHLFSYFYFDLNPKSVEGESNQSFDLIEPSAIRFFTDTNLAQMPQAYIESYTKVIQAIPPMLLRIGCYFDKLSIYQRVVHYLTDQQLLFLFMAIKPKEVFAFLEAITGHLRAHQYTMIIWNLSNDQLSEYLTRKIYKIQEEFEEFRSALGHLTNEVAEYENKPIPKTRYDELYQKALVMQGRANSVINANVYALATCMENMGPHPVFHTNLKDCLFDTISHFQTLYHSRVASRSFIFMQLNLIEKNVVQDETNDTDPFEKIYPQFWTFLTERVLVHLDIKPDNPSKISHGGELPLVGIASNEDLKVIGISQKKQEFVDLLVMKLNSIKGGDGEVQLALADKWTRFLNIGLTDTEKKSALFDLIDYYDIKNVDRAILKKTLKEVCDEVLTLDYLPKVLREDLADGKSLLNGLRLPLPFAERLIKRIAIAILYSQTLFMLRHYLVQPELKSCWELLRQKGIHSLDALWKTGKLKETDLFRLNSKVGLLNDHSDQQLNCGSS